MKFESYSHFHKPKEVLDKLNTCPVCGKRRHFKDVTSDHSKCMEILAQQELSDNKAKKKQRAAKKVAKRYLDGKSWIATL